MGSTCLCVASVSLVARMHAAITVALATLFPGPMSRLVPSGEAMAAVLMQLFFAAIGAAGSVAAGECAPRLHRVTVIAAGALCRCCSESACRLCTQ